MGTFKVSLYLLNKINILFYQGNGLYFYFINHPKFNTMIITTTDSIPSKEIAEIVSVARGNTVRARNIGRDIFAGLKNIVGGEISEYTKLLSMARDEALKRLEEDAVNMGADAVLNVRFTTSSVMAGSSEILAYGTAVKLK